MYKRRSAQCSVHCTSDIVDNTMQTYSLITTKSHMGVRQDTPSGEGAGLVQGRGGSVQTAAHRVSAATGSMQHQRQPAERRVAKPCTRVLVHVFVPRRGPPRLLTSCSFASRRAPSLSAPRLQSFYDLSSTGMGSPSPPLAPECRSLSILSCRPQR